MSDQIQEMLFTEYLRFVEQSQNQSTHYELINGALVQKMVSVEHGLIAALLAGEVYAYFKQNPIGRAGVEISFRMDEANVFIPDVAVMTDGAQWHSQASIADGAPALAVEIKSPSNTILELREKALFYVARGVQMVWVILPQKQMVEVYQPEVDVQIFMAEDVLSGGTVLPAFELPVRTLFSK